jgi:drug/metabolite transporter (DMT)-like permease
MVVHWIYLVVAVLFGIAFYSSSESFKKKNGVTPWNWPSWLWGVVGFASFLIGLILWAIAERRTKSVLARGTTNGGFGSSVPTPVYAQSFTTGTTGAEQALPSMVFGAQPSPPGAWHADPTGRFASRFWDGTSWTEHVSDGTTTTTDPL